LSFFSAGFLLPWRRTFFFFLFFHYNAYPFLPSLFWPFSRSLLGINVPLSFPPPSWLRPFLLSRPPVFPSPHRSSLPLFFRNHEGVIILLTEWPCSSIFPFPSGPCLTFFSFLPPSGCFLPLFQNVLTAAPCLSLDFTLASSSCFLFFFGVDWCVPGSFLLPFMKPKLFFPPLMRGAWYPVRKLLSPRLMAISMPRTSSLSAPPFSP